MDLKKGTITVGELLSHPEAFEQLREVFPQIAGNPLALAMARTWSLRQVLQYAEQAQMDPDMVKRLQQTLERL